MKAIELTQGKVALVDDADFEWLSQWRWHFSRRADQRVGYARRSELVGGQKQDILMHRQILGLLDQPGVKTDHVNGLGIDNQRSNLRACTQMQNARNQRKALRPTSSRYKGVSFMRTWHKWEAKIRVNYRLIHLGGFATQEGAALAYNAAALRYHGEFARLNVVEATP